MQINQIIEVVTEGKKVTEETIKKAEMDFMLDLKSLITKSATDAELNRVKLALTREDRSMAPEHYRQQFGNISTRWGLTFINDKINVPTELRKKLLNTLHFGHAGTTKMTAEAKIFWWPNITEDIEEKVKNCVACLSSAERKPKFPIYVSRDEEGDVTNYLVMIKTKAEEKAVDKQPKKNIRLKRRKNGHRKSETKLHRRIDIVSEASTGNTFSGMKYSAIY